MGRAMKKTRWSYSSLSTYEKCPAKWKYRYIDGLRDPPTPAMERGTRLHSLCESVLKDGAQIPSELSLISEVLERLKVNNAQSEKMWRLDRGWQPAQEAWVKGIIDVHFMRDGVLHIYDFKSGKPYASHKAQLEIYSIMGFATVPEAERVECGAIYIDSGKIGCKRAMTRQEAFDARDGWGIRADKLLFDEEWMPTPGGACWRCNYKSLNGGPCSAWKKA